MHATEDLHQAFDRLLGEPLGGKMSGQPEIGALSIVGQSMIWAPEGPSFSFPCTSNASQLLSIEQDWTFALSSCDAPSRVENSNPPGPDSAAASCQLLRSHSISSHSHRSFIITFDRIASLLQSHASTALLVLALQLLYHVLPELDIITPPSSVRDGATWSI